MEILGKWTSGDEEVAREDLLKLAEVIQRHQAVPEVVNKRGRAVRLLGQKEANMQMAWGAGMFVLAATIVADWIKKTRD